MGVRTEKIREAARALLEEGRVDLVIGFEKGSLPLRATPCFLRSAGEAERLVWDSSCENNLAAYLPRKKERIGIVAKGCDSRSIVGLLQERQVERENLVIIGVPCDGILDRKKVEERLGGRALLDAEAGPETVVLKGGEFEEEVPRGDLLSEGCRTCPHRNPVLYDILAGEAVEDLREVDEFKRIETFEGRSPEERWDYFSRQTGKCIRCYACRNACPVCYCQECSVDSSQPHWFGKSVEDSDTQIFHLMRCFHVAGRCVDCGACVHACPMGVDLRFLNKKVEKDVRELFSFEAGMDPEAPPPLTTHQPDDPGDFVK
jgi:ferredoxin